MSITAQKGVLSWALQPRKRGSGTIAAAKAIAKVVVGALPATGKIVVIGSKTYTYRTALTPAVNEVLIGLTPTTAANNLAAAVEAGSGSGTLYGAGTTANADVNAVVAYQTVELEAVAVGAAGNALALSTDSAAITVVPFAGGATAGAFDESALDYDRHRALDIDYDAAQDTRVFPGEVGGAITPLGAYKAGAFVGGGATIAPRLDGVFGDLLLAAMGSASVEVDTPAVGTNTHTFIIDPNAVEEIPWVAVRKHIPGRGIVRSKGVVGLDNKLASLRIMIPQNDIVQTRVDFLGRVPKFENYSDAWEYANEYENANAVPLSCKGSFKIPTVFAGEMPVTSVVIELVNSLTTPREEMIIGDYFLDDLVVRARQMQIRVVHKWNDPELYERVYTNEAGGTDWSPEVFQTEFDGSNYAFEAKVETPIDIGATSTPFSLTIRAAVVSWEPVGPVMLGPGRIIMQEYRGTVLEPDVSLGAPYAEIILVNAQATAYSVPA